MTSMLFECNKLYFYFLQIISGSKDKNLHVWDMPEQIQEVLDEQ